MLRQLLPVIAVTVLANNQSRRDPKLGVVELIKPDDAGSAAEFQSNLLWSTMVSRSLP